MTTTFRVVEHTLPGQHLREYVQSTKHRQEDIFSLAIKQYIPLDLPNPVPENAITILGFHGNGFPKETYEPFFEDLYTNLRQRNLCIRGIWIADASNQGASGVLNENIQGDQTHWFDHSRDVLHMVNHFREQMPRPIIGVAHSYGCTQLVHLSTLHPRLLSTVVLIEPIMFDLHKFPPGSPNPSFRTLSRRDFWPSRDDAVKSLRRAFGNWDTRVLENYIKHGLRPIPTPIYNNHNNRPAVPSTPTDKPLPHPLPADSVTLTTTKAQESWSFCHYNAWPTEHDITSSQQRHWNRLISPDQDPTVEWNYITARPEVKLALDDLRQLRPSALFVFGGKSNFNPAPFRAEKLAITGTGQGGNGGVKEGRVKAITFDDTSHLITFEKAGVQRAVDASGDWIQDWFGGWVKDEEFMREYLARRDGRASDMEVLRLSQEWVDHTKKPAGILRSTRDKSKL